MSQYSVPVAQNASQEKKDSGAASDEGADEDYVKEVKVKVTGELSVDDGLEVIVQNLVIDEIELRGSKELLKEIKSVKIDLDEVDEVKKEDEIKIRVRDLSAPENTKIISPTNRDKVVLEIEVAKEGTTP